MNVAVLRWQRRIALLTLFFVLVSLLPFVTLAQEPAPAATPAVAPPEPGSPVEVAPPELVDVTEWVTPPADETPLPAATERLTDVLEFPADELIAPAEPAADDGAAPAAEDGPILSGIQGLVRLDVLVTPDKVQVNSAGAYDSITYTYIYTNTGTQPATGIIVRAIWTRFHQDSKTGNWQFCDIADLRDPQPGENAAASKCGVLRNSVQGPTVLEMAADSNGNNVEFAIGDLAPNQSGRFQVRIRLRNDIYPQSGREPTRPAGSAQLFLNNNKSTPISEDTANTLVVGPVFELTKVAAPGTPPQVYPLETVEFIIKVGNATAPGDVSNGQIRADAIGATNVVLRDTFPVGSEFVSAEGNPTVDTTKRLLTWNIPALATGQQREFRVRFRKLDVSGSGCDRLINATYDVTSQEMPIEKGSDPYRIKGKSVTVNVSVPLVVRTVVADPPSAIYGADATIRIVVQNYWNQPVNGAQLIYVIQSNAFYLPGSASPTATSAPTGSTPGGQVVWTFNVAAGSHTTPTETSFTLRVRGGYSRFVVSGTGRASIVAPPGVPSACSKFKDGRVNLLPRLVLTKFSESGEYFVERGDEYPYTIEIENKGTEDAIGVTIRDMLPADPANFSYVQGSATLDGRSREPDNVTNGGGGLLIWENLTIPAGKTVVITYRLVVDGREFRDFCNSASAEIGEEAISYLSRKVCVKINPALILDKKVNNTTVITATPGQVVTFNLSLRNDSTQSYEVALYDVLGKFEFVNQVSSSTGDRPTTDSAGNLAWPLRMLAPGQTMSAVITARVPNACVTTKYINELRFLFRTDGVTSVIRRVPPMQVTVDVRCGTNRIEYSKKADRATISLQDRVIYTAVIKNANTTAEIKNITVVDILPAGFTYVGIDGQSNVSTAPRQEKRADGRIKLTWTIPSIAAGRSVNLVFIARSGDIVGSFENWLTATAPDLLEARCTGTCRALEDEGEAMNYAAPVVKVEPLHTMEPQITDDSCAEPGVKRIYRLSMVNTNNHDYKSTSVTIRLPLGLHFSKALGQTPRPAVAFTSDGETTVSWNNLTVPAKPANQSAALVVLEIELEVGQVTNNLKTSVQVLSPDGSIPRKDGIFDPIVAMCLDAPSIRKDANPRQVDRNGQLIYQIAIGNPTDTALTVTMEDVLPPNFSYMAKVAGPEPTVSGNRLTWSNLTVPARTSEGPGVAIIAFRVRVTSGEQGKTYTNQVVVVNSSPSSLDTLYDSVDVKVAQFFYVYQPFARR